MCHQKGNLTKCGHFGGFAMIKPHKAFSFIKTHKSKTSLSLSLMSRVKFMAAIKA